MVLCCANSTNLLSSIISCMSTYYRCTLKTQEFRTKDFVVRSTHSIEHQKCKYKIQEILKRSIVRFTVMRPMMGPYRSCLIRSFCYKSILHFASTSLGRRRVMLYDSMVLSRVLLSNSEVLIRLFAVTENSQRLAL